MDIDFDMFDPKQHEPHWRGCDHEAKLILAAGDSAHVPVPDGSVWMECWREHVRKGVPPEICNDNVMVRVDLDQAELYVPKDHQSKLLIMFV